MADPLRVLVVDDDPEFLDYVQHGLTDVQAIVARTPLHALWLLEHEHFCAVVCDLCFGDVDGRHLLDVARECCPEAARVLITGFGDRLRDGGDSPCPSAQAVLTKPCDLAALADLLADLPPSA